jgi:hypothetical protein
VTGHAVATAEPTEAFYYYRGDHLEAIRRGSWKLHLKTGELHDLAADIGANPVPMVALDPTHPYVVAMYDSAGKTRRREEMFPQPPPNFR